MCYECKCQYQREHWHAKKMRQPVRHFAEQCWNNIQSRTINGTHPQWGKKSVAKNYLMRGIRVDMTYTQFWYFCDRNSDKIRSMSCPTIDRIDPKENYKIENLQIIEKGDNSRKRRGIRLNEQAVKVIKWMILKEKRQHKELANAYSVSMQTINAIICGDNWSHVTI